ncbi:MAG: hypothetical protein K2N84_03700, partial [Clostridia bacterium]|nr:hypothetical protein [Clostridia bacterium]
EDMVNGDLFERLRQLRKAIATEEGVAEVVAMIGATGVTIPALIAFIAFNMLTIPCFAACATAKSELPKGKFKWTLLFWVCTSYFVSTAIYLIGSWWWTVFIFAVVVAGAVTGIALWNKKHPVKKNSVHVEEALELEAAVSENKKNDI